MQWQIVANFNKFRWKLANIGYTPLSPSPINEKQLHLFLFQTFRWPTGSKLDGNEILEVQVFSYSKVFTNRWGVEKSNQDNPIQQQLPCSLRLPIHHSWGAIKTTQSLCHVQWSALWSLWCGPLKLVPNWVRNWIGNGQQRTAGPRYEWTFSITASSRKWKSVGWR